MSKNKPQTIEEWKVAQKEYWKMGDQQGFHDCQLQIELLEAKNPPTNRCKLCHAIAETRPGSAYYYMICPKCGWVSPMYRNDSKKE
jgi:hypothetical protein